jgi:hypothetical protein
MSAPFDTLQLARGVEAAGFPLDQAGKMAEAVAQTVLAKAGHCRRGIRWVTRRASDDRGAVAVEFAMILPIQLLMIVGTFVVAVVMIQYQQLNFVVQGAARAEAQAPGSGVAFASSQIPAAQFTPTLVPPKPPVPSIACITGQWPVDTVLWQTLTLSAQACSPTSTTSGSATAGGTG